MKRYLYIVIVIIICTNLSGCHSSHSSNFKMQYEEASQIAHNVCDAIVNHDKELLKEQFCEAIREGKETAVDRIYEYMDGEIAKVETNFDTDRYYDVGGGIKRMGDVYSKTFGIEIVLISDKGTRYEICGTGDIVNTITPANQGLQIIYVYKPTYIDGQWRKVNEELTIGRLLKD